MERGKNTYALFLWHRMNTCNTHNIQEGIYAHIETVAHIYRDGKTPPRESKIPPREVTWLLQEQCA